MALQALYSTPYSPAENDSGYQETPSERTTPLEYDPETTVKIFSIAPTKDDGLRLVDHPQNLVPLIRSIIESQWGKINSETSSKTGNSHDFKLNGTPWAEKRLANESARTARLFTKIFTILATEGWNFLQGAAISKRHNAKDVLFFENALIDLEADVFAMTFHKYHLIRLSNASSEIINAVSRAIMRTWPGGIDQGVETHWGYFEFSLHGTPWGQVFTAVKKRMLLGNILTELRRHGYKFYAAVSLTKKQDELDSWFFRKVTAVYK